MRAPTSNSGRKARGAEVCAALAGRGGPGLRWAPPGRMRRCRGCRRKTASFQRSPPTPAVLEPKAPHAMAVPATCAGRFERVLSCHNDDRSRADHRAWQSLRQTATSVTLRGRGRGRLTSNIRRSGGSDQITGALGHCGNRGTMTAGIQHSRQPKLLAAGAFEGESDRPAPAGSRGQVAQNDPHVHRGGAVNRRRSPSPRDRPHRLGAGLRGCPALDGLAAEPLQQLMPATSTRPGSSSLPAGRAEDRSSACHRTWRTLTSAARRADLGGWAPPAGRWPRLPRRAVCPRRG
jgi:hypothetical protein